MTLGQSLSLTFGRMQWQTASKNLARKAVRINPKTYQKWALTQVHGHPCACMHACVHAYTHTNLSDKVVRNPYRLGLVAQWVLGQFATNRKHVVSVFPLIVPYHWILIFFIWWENLAIYTHHIWKVGIWERMPNVNCVPLIFWTETLHDPLN